MKEDLKELTKEERRQLKSLDVFVRTVIKRRTINHVNSYLLENRPWKELLHLAKALADINPKYLQCLISSVLLDKDDEEIAREMDLSANTVRIYRGRGAAQARKKGGGSDEEA